jgi:hypothetical protein
VKSDGEETSAVAKNIFAFYPVRGWLKTSDSED